MRAAALLLAVLAIPCALADDPPTGTIAGRIEHRFVNHVYPAAVWVEAVPGRTFEAPSEPVRVDQKDQVFRPRVVPVLVGTEVQFLNSDSVQHNVKSSPECCQPFDVGDFGPGEIRSIVAEHAGVIPLSCRVHSSMVAYVVVVETPWFATTDRQGKFEIAGVPPGEYRVTFWHEKFVSRTETVRVEAGETAELSFRDLERR